MGRHEQRRHALSTARPRCAQQASLRPARSDRAGLCTPLAQRIGHDARSIGRARSRPHRQQHRRQRRRFRQGRQRALSIGGCARRFGHHQQASAHRRRWRAQLSALRGACHRARRRGLRGAALSRPNQRDHLRAFSFGRGGDSAAEERRGDGLARLARRRRSGLRCQRPAREESGGCERRWHDARCLDCQRGRRYFGHAR